MTETPSREHIRLYVDAPLAHAAKVMLGREQTHYLRNVMRAKAGGTLGLFNGRDGEWRAAIRDFGKHTCTLAVQEQIQPQWRNPDLWLLFAVVKRVRTELIVEKATELGVREIRPLLTQYTNAPRVKPERLGAISIEAAEQCGLVSVPLVHSPEPMLALLDKWPPDRRILFCDEMGGDGAALKCLQQAVLAPGTAQNAPWAVLTGPEGGFSPAERARLHLMPQALAVSLGPRILRADTAAIVALGLWQSLCGDWASGSVAPPPCSDQMVAPEAIPSDP